MDEKSTEGNAHFFKSMGIISMATALSRILGLVREQVFAFFFGASFASDAFLIAFRIPNLFRDLLAEGAMRSALIPIYTKIRKKQGEEVAWSVARKLICLLSTILTLMVALGICFAEPIVDLIAHSFRQTPGKFELTVSLTTWLIPFLPIIVLAAVCMALLNARNRFTTPALAPASFNIFCILSMLALAPQLPAMGIHPIYSMVVGVLVGGMGQWLLQVPALRREGFRFHLDMQWKNKELGKIVRYMGMGAVGLAAMQVNVLVNSFFAASQGDGAVSWLNYAFRLMQFPIGVFGVSIAQVTLTQVSILHSRSEAKKMCSTITQSLRINTFLTIPSAIGLAVLSVPITSVIYGHGSFGFKDVILTAQALACYSIGLAAYSCNKIMTPILYSLSKASIAVASAIVAVVINIVLCVLWIDTMGFTGLALATSVSALCHCSILYAATHYYARYLSFKELMFGFLGQFFAGSIMGIVVWYYWLYYAPTWQDIIFYKQIYILACGVLMGTVTYWVVARLLGLAEVLRVERFILKKMFQSRKEKGNKGE